MSDITQGRGSAQVPGPPACIYDVSGPGRIYQACGQPGEHYGCGWRCAQHAPAIRETTSPGMPAEREHRARPPAIRLTQPAQPCTCPGCSNPARPFPGGWWCSDHPCRGCQCNRTAGGRP